MAQKYFLTSVINTTQQYLNDNIIEIYQYGPDQFFQLTFDQLKYLLNNDCLQIFSELDLFLMIVKWIEAADNANDDTLNKKDSSIVKNKCCTEIDQTCEINNKNENEIKTENDRLKHAPELIKFIRFMCMTAEELADFVEPVDFMKNVPECNLYLMNAYRYHA